MPQSDEEKWDRIYQSREETTPQPARVLSDNLYLLPQSGSALDAACGRGGNALLLARRGLQTHAWDISQEALKMIQRAAASEDLSLVTEQRDIVLQPPAANSFDVIVVSHFLDRSITAALSGALRHNGLLYYQTFIKDKRDPYGPKNPDYRLDTNELLQLFAGLQVIYYREDGTIGDLNHGVRNEAMLVARRR